MNFPAGFTANPETVEVDTSRRRFVTGAAGAMVSLSTGVMLMNMSSANAATAATGADARRRWGLLIDTNKCADGCTDCVSACQDENGWGTGSTDEANSRDEQKAQWIRKVTVKDKQSGHSMELPMMCQHCENPPCVDVCPTNASMKRPDGIVQVDKHRCIGCRYCMMACPYKARSFVHEALHDQRAHAPRGKGTVESCNLCAHRVDRGQIPACVERCTKENHNAMLFGDLNDPNSAISDAMKQHGGTEIRADLGLNLGVRYQGI